MNRMRITMVMFMGLAFILVATAQADPRVQAGANTHPCHFPRDSVDTDNEDKIICKGIIHENADGGAFAAFAYVKTEGLHPDMVPANTVVEDNGANGDCVVQNDNGTQTQVADWEVVIKGACRTRSDADGGDGGGPVITCFATHSIRCGTYADAQGLGL